MLVRRSSSDAGTRQEQAHHRFASHAPDIALEPVPNETELRDNKSEAAESYCAQLSRNTSFESFQRAGTSDLYSEFDCGPFVSASESGLSSSLIKPNTLPNNSTPWSTGASSSNYFSLPGSKSSSQPDEPAVNDNLHFSNRGAQTYNALQRMDELGVSKPFTGIIPNESHRFAATGTPTLERVISQASHLSYCQHESSSHTGQDVSHKNETAGFALEPYKEFIERSQEAAEEMFPDVIIKGPGLELCDPKIFDYGSVECNQSHETLGFSSHKNVEWERELLLSDITGIMKPHSILARYRRHTRADSPNNKRVSEDSRGWLAP